MEKEAVESKTITKREIMINLEMSGRGFIPKTIDKSLEAAKEVKRIRVFEGGIDVSPIKWISWGRILLWTMIFVGALLGIRVGFS
ncbi:MAG: hypothetical protein KAR54_02755 [Candidatus Pacebacteria bacterium]|nr:hypothetical protein [Candidatus Paceibacterota bacterium]